MVYEIIKSKKGDLNSGFDILDLTLKLTFNGTVYDTQIKRIDFDLPRLKDPERLKEWERYKWNLAKTAELDKLEEEFRGGKNLLLSFEKKNN